MSMSVSSMGVVSWASKVSEQTRNCLSPHHVQVRLAVDMRQNN